MHKGKAVLCNSAQSFLPKKKCTGKRVLTDFQIIFISGDVEISAVLSSKRRDKRRRESPPNISGLTRNGGKQTFLPPFSFFFGVRKICLQCLCATGCQIYSK
jgi:hypothetical protein